jgi:hypothetical protein
MLRLAMPAMLCAGLFLLPAEHAAAQPVCVTITVTVNGATLPIGPVCVPYDGVTDCGERSVTLFNPAIAVVVAYCIPA